MYLVAHVAIVEFDELPSMQWHAEHSTFFAFWNANLAMDINLKYDD